MRQRSGELVATIEAIPASLGRPEMALADHGYAHGAEVESLAKNGVAALVATGEGAQAAPRLPPGRARRPAEGAPGRMARGHGGEARERAGPALSKLRQQTVEPVFGIIKAVLGFTGFSLRGRDKVAGEWHLVALAYNCKRLHQLKLATAG